MCGVYFPDGYFTLGLVRLGRSPLLVLGANLEVNRKTLAGILGPGFWVAVPLCRKTKWEICVLSSGTCSEIPEEGWNDVEVLLGEGRVFKCFSYSGSC